MKRINRQKAFQEMDYNCRSAVLLMISASVNAGAAKTVHPVRQAAHAKRVIEFIESAMLELAEARRHAETICGNAS